MNRAIRPALGALALLAGGLALPAHADNAPPAPAQPARWGFEGSDIALDPAFHCGRLANGLRYIIVPNATPKGVAMVRMLVEAGSLDEHDDERGYAHFLEHMAFQGSTHVKQGEMVRLLERLGLAFGADTNAFTGYDNTLYTLDLPRNDPALLDTALMLFRETASELAFPPDALERERGVVLAEKRDRNTYTQRTSDDSMGFFAPDARYAHRLPIGTPEALAAANPQKLRAYWKREYVPAKTTVIVVGDMDAATVEAAIRTHFADWPAAASPPQPSPGPIDPADAGRTHIWQDPALADAVTAMRLAPWQGETDTLANRREHLLRHIAYSAFNRRLQRLSRQASPPFQQAVYGTHDVFHVARGTSLAVEDVNGQWQKALKAAVQEYRRMMAQGFTQAEIDEQVANLEVATSHAVASTDTRTDATLLRQAFALVREGDVPALPEVNRDLLRAMKPDITPRTVMEALRREAVPLDAPLLRFQGSRPFAEGEAGLRAGWNEAMQSMLLVTTDTSTRSFAYTSFGNPGKVVADDREPQLGIRRVRFANGVRLNLKHTDLVKDEVLVQVNLDGGGMLETRADPLAISMVDALTAGGLGKHSQDELQSVLAGHHLGVSMGAIPDRFVYGGMTTPGDLLMQMQLTAALITDPGWRPEGETQFRLGVANSFAQLRASPANALSGALGTILSDGDPRFSLHPHVDYAGLSFDRLRVTMADRMGHGAIELGIVGDIDEDKTIAAVATTLGALPPREADFRPYPEQRTRPFTRDYSRRLVFHQGPKDQAAINLTWLTRDDSDPLARQKMNLLERVVQVQLTEGLRQKLGKSYSPGASSDLSRYWTGYGTFGTWATVDVKDLAATRAAMRETIATLAAQPVSEDVLQRAREPMVEAYDNDLKTNGGWIFLVARAQSEPVRIDRQIRAKERALVVTTADLQAAAREYLSLERVVETDVLPQPPAPPPSPLTAPPPPIARPVTPANPTAINVTVPPIKMSQPRDKGSLDSVPTGRN